VGIQGPPLLLLVYYPGMPLLLPPSVLPGYASPMLNLVNPGVYASPMLNLVNPGGIPPYMLNLVNPVNSARFRQF